MPLIHWNGRIVEIMAYMAVFLTERVTAVEQKLLPFTKYLNLVGLVLLIFLVFCVVSLCLFVFVLCLVYPMLPVFLDFPFLIGSSVSSNVYLFRFQGFVLINMGTIVCLFSFNLWLLITHFHIFKLLFCVFLSSDFYALSVTV